MGFAANSARLYMLISRQRDLELEAQLISQHRLYLANSMSQFIDLQARYEPGTEPARLLDARIRMLQQADKAMELQINRISNQSKAIEQEVEGVRKLIDNNIKSSFGLMGR
jgi:hypothetical protein